MLKKKFVIKLTGVSGILQDYISGKGHKKA